MPHCCSGGEHASHVHKLHIDAKRTLFQLKGGNDLVTAGARLVQYHCSGAHVPSGGCIGLSINNPESWSRRAAEPCTMKEIIYLIIEDFPLQPSSLLLKWRRLLEDMLLPSHATDRLAATCALIKDSGKQRNRPPCSLFNMHIYGMTLENLE